MIIIRMVIPLLILASIFFILWQLYSNVLLPNATENDERIAKREAEGVKAVENYFRVRSTWLSYELDDEALLERPSMVDMRVPEVAFFHRELRRFEEKYPDSPKMAKNAPVSDEFIQDAQLLVQALKEAEKRSDELDRGN